eukprot:gnl/MRDRNA2_/MRDRNA2_64766_c0_seq1.p1 gnl/MRDRNA2_/MRDRNA2_64766_c0~~gnl/MRDRNA2_/MRDRNA2_64766_c0_seq1.p1  ORF type:complete len:329 (+),score=47.71 gnl/MRDRNA2_/MRDRNA2_64766_c0_seq1:45-1031(+)
MTTDDCHDDYSSSEIIRNDTLERVSVWWQFQDAEYQTLGSHPTLWPNTTATKMLPLSLEHELCVSYMIPYSLPQQSKKICKQLVSPKLPCKHSKLDVTDVIGKGILPRYDPNSPVAVIAAKQKAAYDAFYAGNTTRIQTYYEDVEKDWDRLHNEQPHLLEREDFNKLIERWRNHLDTHEEASGLLLKLQSLHQEKEDKRLSELRAREKDGDFDDVNAWGQGGFKAPFGIHRVNPQDMIDRFARLKHQDRTLVSSGELGPIKIDTDEEDDRQGEGNLEADGDEAENEFDSETQEPADTAGVRLDVRSSRQPFKQTNFVWNVRLDEPSSG